MPVALEVHAAGPLVLPGNPEGENMVVKQALETVDPYTAHFGILVFRIGQRSRLLLGLVFRDPVSRVMELRLDTPPIDFAVLVACR